MKRKVSSGARRSSGTGTGQERRSPGRTEHAYPPPTPPWSTNAERNMHHHARHKLHATWRDCSFLEAKRAKIPHYAQGIVVQVWIPFTTQRKRDPHNYCGTVLKAIVDGLVLARVVIDDEQAYLAHRESILYKGDAVRVLIEPM